MTDHDSSNVFNRNVMNIDNLNNDCIIVHESSNAFNHSPSPPFYFQDLFNPFNGRYHPHFGHNPIPFASNEPVEQTLNVPIENDSDQKQKNYEVEKVVTHTMNWDINMVEYIVKWKGYPESENSLVSDTESCEAIIAEYWCQKCIDESMKNKKKNKIKRKKTKKISKQQMIAMKRSNKKLKINKSNKNK